MDPYSPSEYSQNIVSFSTSNVKSVVILTKRPMKVEIIFKT